MILSNRAIMEAIDQGRLEIDPPPSRILGSLDWRFNSSSLDLCLANVITIPNQGPFNYDLRRGGIAKFLADNSESLTITDSTPYVLNVQKFVLGRTIERINLPIVNTGNCLAARVEGRSSIARCGVLVHFTAPTIHAGFQGTITLEIINLGAADFTLYPGMPICQLIIEEVAGVPIESPSQFQGQSTPSGTK